MVNKEIINENYQPVSDLSTYFKNRLSKKPLVEGLILDNCF